MFNTKVTACPWE